MSPATVHIQLASTLAEKPFTAADRVLVHYLRQELGESDEQVLLAAALTNAAARQGHTYLDLAAPPDFFPSGIPWPSPEVWASSLAKSPSVGDESDCRPLTLCDGNALYLRKYYEHEHALAEALSRFAAKAPTSDPVATDNRDAIVQRALRSRLFVITGGPGTGKTTIALTYLSAFLETWTPPDPPRIATVAPTGKAAARLAESIASGLQRLQLPETTTAVLAKTPCLTIHRLLGSLPSRASFRHHKSNPLDLDVLVVDEASMIDLPLMRRLFDAIPEHCSVLLLGDKDQLASVEVGSVLSDILAASEDPDCFLTHQVARLTKTYRFHRDSSIFLACQAAQSGNLATFQSLLQPQGSVRCPQRTSPQAPDPDRPVPPGSVRCPNGHQPPDPSDPNPQQPPLAPRDDFAFHPISSEARQAPKALIEAAIRRHHTLLQSIDPTNALQSLNASIILTPTRIGPFGTLSLNAEVTRRLALDLGVSPDAALPGTPIIVLENNYDLDLFNGDLGLLWQETDATTPVAIFPGQATEVRRLRLSELPRHEPAYALTIHKSQGSEFDETLALFGPSESELLTRELLYTCFSRARHRLEIHANPETLANALTRRATRATRLAHRLTRRGGD